MNNITENVKVVELSAREFLQDVDKKIQDLDNIIKNKVSFINGEKAKLTKKRQDTETELEKIRTEINQGRQQYAEILQQHDETMTVEMEKRLSDLESTEHTLTLRIDALSKISGCDNGKTEDAFNELYAAYNEMIFNTDFSSRYKKNTDDINKIEESIQAMVGEIELAYNRYSRFINIRLSDSVIHAYEQIYGELKAPKHQRSYSDHDKIMIISANMREKRSV